MRKSKEEKNVFEFLKEIDDPDERERFRREFCLLEYDDSGYRRPRDVVGNGYHSQLNKAIMGHTEEQQIMHALVKDDAIEAIRRMEVEKKQAAETRHFMNRDQAREVYDAASFLTQEYNVFFNAFITIAYKALLIDEERLMTSRLTSFLDEAGEQMKRWGFEEWHYLYVHENSEERGLHTHILAYVPPQFKEPFIDWCRDSHRSFFWRHCGVASKEAIDIQIKRPRTPESAAGWQWDRIQYVTKGLNPNLIERDPASGQMKSVFDLIGQRPNYRRACGVIPFKLRVNASKLIRHTAQAKAAEEGMPMLSAFGDKAWSHLKLGSNWLGWEAKEYDARTRRRAEYREIQGPLDPDEAAQWIDQHRGEGSESVQDNVGFETRLLRQLREKKADAWRAEDVRQWRRDWITWWEYERYVRQAANSQPPTWEELEKTLQI